MYDTTSPFPTFWARRDENIFEMIWTLLVSNWTYFGSKIGILGPECPLKSKISGKHIKKLMLRGYVAQLFRSFVIKIFLKMFGPILGSKWAYFGSKISIFELKCPWKWKISGMILGLLAHRFKPIDMKIFKMIWPSFRFQMDISWVQNWIF